MRSLPKPCCSEIAAKGPSELLLHLVQPLPVSVDDALRKPPVEPKCGRAVREPRLPLRGRRELPVELVEVIAECVKALEQFPPIGVRRAEEPDDGLVLDACRSCARLGCSPGT